MSTGTAPAPARSIVRDAINGLTGNGRRTTKEPTFEVEDVTPAKAAKWLARNNRNRQLNKSAVFRYASDLRNGRWRVNGEAIKLDADGNLLDGQTRLSAVVESGVTMRTVVARNVDPSAFATMDQGRKRGGADHLHLCGYKNVHALSTAAGHLRRYQRGDFGATDAKSRFVSGPEVVETVEQHPELEASVTRALPTNVCGSVGMFAFLHFVFAKKDRVLADWFIDALGSGADLRINDPVYRLRERLLRRGIGVRVQERVALSLTITAWNKTRQGKSIQRLDAPLAFPDIE